MPVKIALEGLVLNTNLGQPVLYEITTKGEKYFPSQLETGHSFMLWFLLPPSDKPQKREFLFRLEEFPGSLPGTTKVNLKKDEKDLSMVCQDKPILNYRYAITYPPAGIDPLYKRSGFIHPLWSPGGTVLTQIQPPDHYHHYGIWGPWTLTHIEGREVDFWNLAKGQGTVNFSQFLSETEGNIYSGFQALQQHMDFGAPGEDQVALNEILDVRVWNVGDNIRIIDYTTTLNTPLENGILLDAYRYGGGLGFRATERWHKDNCTVLTSENKTRPEADGTNARWCIVEGESDSGEGRSGILFLSHPANRMHPEPMRVLPLDASDGRGDMFFEFTPIRHQEWKLEPGQGYTLKYRMIVFDGLMNRELAEEYWRNFAEGVRVEVIREN
ncbi:MAG: PmoA family protein [Bacteroidales bacterium]|nr:PmoA family protein [Bacteroidales bacterium]